MVKKAFYNTIEHDAPTVSLLMYQKNTCGIVQLRLKFLTLVKLILELLPCDLVTVFEYLQWLELETLIVQSIQCWDAQKKWLQTQDRSDDNNSNK